MTKVSGDENVTESDGSNPESMSSSTNSGDEPYESTSSTSGGGAFSSRRNEQERNDNQNKQRLPLQAGLSSSQPSISCEPSSRLSNNKDGRREYTAPTTSSGQGSSGQGTETTSDSSPTSRAVVRLPTDVLCGRGIPIQTYPGNIRLHQLVNSVRQQYQQTPRQHKPLVIKEIVRRARAEGSRFLRRIETGKEGDYWEEVEDDIAYQKVSHALRNQKYRDEKKAKVEAESRSSASAGLPSNIVASYGGGPKAAASLAPPLAGALGGVAAGAGDTSTGAPLNSFASRIPTVGDASSNRTNALFGMIAASQQQQYAPPAPTPIPPQNAPPPLAMMGSGGSSGNNDQLNQVLLKLFMPGQNNAGTSFAAQAIPPAPAPVASNAAFSSLAISLLQQPQQQQLPTVQQQPQPQYQQPQPQSNPNAAALVNLLLAQISNSSDNSSSTMVNNGPQFSQKQQQPQQMVMDTSSSSSVNRQQQKPLASPADPTNQQQQINTLLAALAGLVQAPAPPPPPPPPAAPPQQQHQQQSGVINQLLFGLAQQLQQMQQQQSRNQTTTNASGGSTSSVHVAPPQQQQQQRLQHSQQQQQQQPYDQQQHPPHGRS
jgi:hypothetical protein